jgi:hypothetical protein
LIKGWVCPIAVICIPYQAAYEDRYHLTQYVFFLMNSARIACFEPKGTIPDLSPVHVPFGDLAY